MNIPNPGSFPKPPALVMVEKAEKREFVSNLPTAKILQALKERIREGNPTTLDKGASNTVTAVYLVNVAGGRFVVKTYKPFMRNGQEIDVQETADNMRASIRFHREFFRLERFMVDTDIAVTDLGDSLGEQVCVVQQHAKGNKLNIHMERMAGEAIKKEFMANWAYGRKDTEKLRKKRKAISEGMLKEYAQAWVRRMPGKKEGGEDASVIQEASNKMKGILQRLDEVLSTFVDQLLVLANMPNERRERLYQEEYGIRFAMRSSPDRGTEAVPAGLGILAADLFRGRNIIVDALEGRTMLFDFVDLREFENIEKLLDHYVTGLRQAFLVHPDPKFTREKANGRLGALAQDKIHPKAAFPIVPDILGEYSLLLPLLPKTERALLELVTKYKLIKKMGTNRTNSEIQSSLNQIHQQIQYAVGD